MAGLFCWWAIISSFLPMFTGGLADRYGYKRMVALAVGASLAFSLTAAAYVMPQILGGNFSPLLGTLIEQQVLTLSDWPFGAAISTLLILVVLSVNLFFICLLNRHFSRWTGGAK